MDEKTLPPEIQELWEEHENALFPKGFAGMDMDGIDFVMLDADIAGCVSTYLQQGRLDLWRTAILGLCYRDARHVYPLLNEEGSSYYGRLERMAELVLREVARQSKRDHWDEDQ